MVVGQAFDQAIKGDYAEETTPVGTLAQIGVGFIPVADTITDIRDFTIAHNNSGINLPGETPDGLRLI